MSSGGFDSTLDLRLAPSHRALRLLYLIHLVPLAIVPWAMQPGVFMILVVAGFGLSWWWLRRHPAFGFGPKALVRLVWQPGSPSAGDDWHLHQARGAASAARLLNDSYVAAWLIVLNFRGDDGKRCSRVLLGDELPQDSLRRLRARLLAHNPQKNPPQS